MPFAAVVEVSSLDGTNGFQFSGVAADDLAGHTVASAGDINGDGIEDFIVSGPGIGASNNGGAYVVFGRASGFPANLDLSTLNGANGFRIDGEASSFAGSGTTESVVSAAGDLNGDGIDDLVIGAPGASPHGAESGAAWVLFGRNTAVSGNFASAISLAALNGTDGFQINGEALLNVAGTTVAAAGDINHDGVDDLLITANRASPNGVRSGQSYIVFGHTGAFSANFELNALDGTNGFQMNGAAADDYAGWSASGIGDMNGDGVDDFVIGAFGVDANGASSGAAYVVFGHSGAFAANIELSSLNGTNGFRLTGAAAGDRAGNSVSSAGDINGDGFADLAIGSYGVDTNGAYSGAVYVVFGKNTAVSGAFSANFALSSLNGTNGFRIDGMAGDYAGHQVANAGDVNGDGITDLVISAYRAAPNGAYSGAVWVVYGKTTGFGAVLDLSTINGTNGFKINGEFAGDNFGFDVSSGDFNGDGLSDILVGAPYGDAHGSNSGAGYVIFGQPAAASAPTVSGDGTESLTAINEDAAPASLTNTVSTIFGGQFSDASNTFAGVAITANGSSAGTGQWQYWNGSAWTNIGASSAASSTVLTAATPLRFLPAADFNGAAPTLTAKLIDSSAGALTNGSHLDTSGASTSVSTGTVVLSETVTAVNDAPTVAGDGTETLAATNEDTNNNALTNTVSSLFGAQFSDAADQVSGGSSANTFAGIAVTVNGSAAGTGQWQYWNGASWVNIGASSTASATVITAATALRFAPAANFNGAAPTLTVKLIDSSAGALTNGSHIDVTTSGGTTAYSTGTVVLDHVVTAVNDAPTVIGGTTTTLLAVSEDTANPAGATVSALFGSHFSDAADNVAGGSSPNSFAGIMIGINNSNAAQGHWQVFSGGSWFDLPALSPTNTYLISASDSLRFVPAADYNGTPGGIVVLLIDNSAGAVVTGTRLDSSLTGSGGSTVYSNSTMTLGTSITAVNDAPAVNADTTAAFTEGGGAIAVTPAFTVADVDNANLTGATVTISDLRAGDVLAFTDQNGITGSYNAGTGVLTLSGTASVANYQAAIRSITYDGAADANFGGTDNSRTVNIVVTDGTTPSSQTATVISIANGVVVGGVANDDAVSTNENAVLSGNVESNNGGGADTGVTAVTAVNGSAVSVGTQITLPSGALLTLNADGTFSYNPNGKFDYLGAAASGAVDITATDSFTYTVNGGDTATVTVTINGVDSTGDILQGSSGANTINGGAGNDTINGLGGDDILSGGDGNDIVNGGDNNDILNGNDGNDKLNGDAGADTLNGGLGADILHGGTGDDHLYGGADNDTMYGDGGNDDMHGGTGNDIYYVDDPGDTVDEAVGEGSDIVRASITWTLSANVETLQLQGVGNIDGTGNELANNLQGNDGNNTLSGMAGVDTINGGAGNDRIIGGTGNDLLTGGTGADTFVVLAESVYSSKAPAGKALEIDFVYDLNKAEGDKLDLSAIDANAVTAGDQAFTLVSAFDKHAGQMTLAYTASTNLTLLSLDVDGDGKADYQMKITGDVHLDSGGWIL